MKFEGRINVDHVLNSEWLEAIMAKEAAEAAGRARAAAPADTGELKASISSRTEFRGGAKRDRVVGIVEATAPHSLATEFGNSRSRGRFYLRGSL